MFRKYWTYIMSNKNNTTLYIGVTDNLEARVQEHRNGTGDSFTHRYNCDKLVYFEEYSDINQAIDREKQLKKWRREKKDNLIDLTNKDRIDLMPEISPLATLGRNDNKF